MKRTTVASVMTILQSVGLAVHFSGLLMQLLQLFQFEIGFTVESSLFWLSQEVGWVVNKTLKDKDLRSWAAMFRIFISAISFVSSVGLINSDISLQISGQHLTRFSEGPIE